MSEIKPVPKLVEDVVSRHHDKTALMWPVGGKYQHLTYGETWENIGDLASGFVNLGLDDEERIAMFTENRKESPISEYATQRNRSVFVPLYERRPKNDIVYILNDSGVSAVIVLNPEELKKIKDIRDNLPNLQYVITFDGEKDYAHDVIPLSEVMKLGDNEEKEISDSLYGSLSLGDPAKIIYTSGTTGEPKGVFLDHLALAYNALASKERLGVNSDDKTISYLPLAHSLEANNQNVMLISGGTIVYSSREKMAKHMLKAKPTLVAGVPLVFEKIHKGVTDKVDGKSAFERFMFKTLTSASKKYHQTRKSSAKPFSYLFLPLDSFARRKVYQEIKKKTGGNLKFFISGGAPLDKEISKSLEAWGIPVVEGYGLTENSPVVSVNDPDNIKHGTVGRPLNLVIQDEKGNKHGPTKVKTDKEGVLLVKGPSVMKYYLNKPEVTNDVLKDGWLDTGDIASIDVKGYITITGRKKEIVVLSTGENVALAKVEQLVKRGVPGSDVVVFGDKRKYPVALIFPGEDGFKIDETDVRRYLEEMNEDLPNYEQIRKFRIMSKPLDEKRELTPTLKVKRKTVENNYRDKIAELYQEDA